MKQFTVWSPAKINLNLRVLGLKSGGLHEIRSVVQPVSIFDEVRVRIVRRGISLQTDAQGHASGVPSGKKNLAYLAAENFINEANLSCGVEIFLKKTVPPGSGLGGGSGNAAAALTALNRIFGVFDFEKLREIARKIGCDVPLFLDCRTAEISGAGEKILPLPDFPLLSYVVCAPGFECRSADVYKKWDALQSAGQSGLTNRTPEKFWRVNPPVPMFNDLEPAAFSLHPEFADFRARIEAAAGAEFLMTGSGSAFFSAFENHREAASVFRRLESAGDFQIFLACGIDSASSKIP